VSPAKRLTVALVSLLVLVLAGYFIKGMANDSPSATVPGADSGLSVTALSALPKEAAQTWELIKRGGPFPYPRNDGVTFYNREKRLPEKPKDYYREYTVPTPGSNDRGPRRIVTGSTSEVYYTADHYASFVVVDVTR
jgi:ribonuclease T1